MRRDGTQLTADGRLPGDVADPATAPGPPVGTGTHRLDHVGAPGTLLHVPAPAEPDLRRPLLVMLHGAGGTAEQALRLVHRQADRHGAVVLAVKSSAATWDVIRGGGFGPDIRRLEAALTHVFASCPVDVSRVAVGGFSDGASYALSVGLSNGGLFGHVMAFSPGFYVADRRSGRPAIFVCHGDADRVLPVAATSRRIVPRLQPDYDVRYVEFAGGHTVPAELVDTALRWWLGG